MIPRSRIRKCECHGNAFQRKINGRHEVYCSSCENTTGLLATAEAAIRTWNTQTSYEGVAIDSDDYYDYFKRHGGWDDRDNTPWKGVP